MGPKHDAKQQELRKRLVHELALLLTSFPGDHHLLADVIVTRVDNLMTEAARTPWEVSDLLRRYVGKSPLEKPKE